MNTQKSIPNRDSDFNIAQNIIATMANTNRTKWNLDAAWMDGELLPHKAAWEKAWADYEDPATRTPLIIFAKKENRQLYEKLLRVLVKNLQSSTLVTDDERRAMGIVIPSSSRKPKPRPDSYPEFSISSSTIRWLSIHYRDQGSESDAKPDGVHGAEIRWAILENPPASVNNLSNSSFDTRTPFAIEFEEKQRGKTVYFCLRWENTRGEKGPWSEIVSAIIP